MISDRDWKSIAEFVGIVALVLSLLFVGLQMKQTNAVAYMELDTAMVGIMVDIADLVAAHPDLWVRGNAGAELSATDNAVYQQIIATMSTRWVVAASHAGQLGRDDIADLIRRDWAGFLHRNPGARRAWLAREQGLIEYRRLLAPDEDFSAWRDSIQSMLNILDEAVE